MKKKSCYLEAKLTTELTVLADKGKFLLFDFLSHANDSKLYSKRQDFNFMHS